MSEKTTVDVATCPGPDGEPIPLLHFENDHPEGLGMLAVSFTPTNAVFTTPSHPFDVMVNPVMLSTEDKRVLGYAMLVGLSPMTVAVGDRVTKLRYPDSGIVDEIEDADDPHGPVHVNWDKTGSSWEYPADLFPAVL